MNQTEMLIIYVAVLGVVASFPIALDILLAYRSSDKKQDLLGKKEPAGGLDPKEQAELIREILKSPSGIPGLARYTLAMTVIMVLAIAVVHILVVGCPTKDSQIVNNILSMLAGLLAAITGFYFGGRAAEKKAEGGKG